MDGNHDIAKKHQRTVAIVYMVDDRELRFEFGCHIIATPTQRHGKFKNNPGAPHKKKAVMQEAATPRGAASRLLQQQT